MNLKKYDLKISGGCKRWDDALPIGNGKLGALIYGTENIKLSLDRIDLWDNRLAPAATEEKFNFETLKALVASDSNEDWKEYTRLFDDVYLDTAYPTKITAGRLTINFDDPFLPDFSLSLKSGVARVTDLNGKLRLEAFASATDFVGVARVWGGYSSELHLPRYISAPNEVSGNISVNNNTRGLGYPEAEIIREDGFLYYVQKTATALEYSTVIFEVKRDEFTELYFTIASNEDSDDYISRAKEELLAASRKGYAKLLRTHRAWWREYWDCSEVNVGDSLIESVYYKSQYLFASCSRKGFAPMPLQGVWTADSDMLPPWKGDYHHDTNTQLSYQSYLKSNHLPEGEIFCDYLWNLRPTFTAFAHNFYGVDGLIIPAVSTFDGKALGGWAQYALSPTMTIWTAQSFDEYYLYTGDEDFLRERAYPFLSDTARAIESLLCERGGKLYLPLSSSPEIHDNRREAYLTPNSNFDLALMQYLFLTLEKYSAKLGKLEEEAHYAETLSKLDDIAIDERNVILLSPDEKLNESHRHFSHLMCLYPLHLINYDLPNGPAIYDRALYEIERLGRGAWFGFSFAMAAQIYAMARQGNGAYQNIRAFAHGYVNDNGFHLNGDFKRYGYSANHGRPFSLESSFGFCDALQEMLLQEHEGYVHLFPAIPDEWKAKEISFRDLRSYGGVLVSATRERDGVTNVTLRVASPRSIRLRNPFTTDSVVLTDASGTRKANAVDGFVSLDLTVGETQISADA